MIAIIARGACSSLGESDAAFGVGRVGDGVRSRVVRDDELAAAGLRRPFAARASLEVPTGGDRATALLDRALEGCERELDRALPSWRGLRVGAAIGTSSGGMRSFEKLVASRSRPDVRVGAAATYIGPLVESARSLAFEPVSLVLAACASSTIAIGLARAWLLEDRCDIALCGGFDAVSVFVAAGFESLRATCGEDGPRPFREGRDGIGLGEGAALLALAGRPVARRASRVHAWITGFGASCDALHLTAPDPAGAGLYRAASAALVDAESPNVDLVSAHGTATIQNDASEAATITSLGIGAPVFSFKGLVGHTLGAAGALETLAAVLALQHGVVPATAGHGRVERGLRVLDRAEASPMRTALKLSSAFGGANAALVVSTDPPASDGPHALADVFVSRAVSVTLTDTDASRLAERTSYGADRIGRADDLVRLSLAAVLALSEHVRADLRGAGIVVGHGLATVDTNARFFARVLDGGARRAEPRRFPYTTPNAAAGECAVAFGLTGPAFAVGGGPHGGIEALCVAADLVRTGVANRVVVVAVDAPGDMADRLSAEGASGAVAFLVGADEDDAVARLSSCTVRLEAGPVRAAPLPSMTAHASLLPFVRDSASAVDRGGPLELRAEIPWGGFASARLIWREFA